jgi:hypothetical protein
MPNNFRDTVTVIGMIRATGLPGCQVQSGFARLEDSGKIERVGEAYRLKVSTPVLSSLMADIFG